MATSQFEEKGAHAIDTLLTLGSTREAGLSAKKAEKRLDTEGPNEVAEEKNHPLLVFVRKFWGASAWMIELIVMISFLLGKRTDFWVALSLLVINAILSFMQETRANAAVAALRQRLNVLARVLRDGAWMTVPARCLVRGDVVRMRAGDFVPADVQVIEGELKVDQSALTGESRPAAKGADQSLYSGSVVREGEATAVVTATGARTYFGRTTHLVGSAAPKLHVEEVIKRVVRWLFTVVGTMVALTLLIATMRGLPLLDTLPIVLVVLMSAMPVALPVMFTVSMSLGSMELSRNGVLITRLGAVEDAATMDMLCADKTGTLTMNRLAFAGASLQSGFSEEDIVRIAAFASNAANADPIDLAFLQAAAERRLVLTDVVTRSFLPFSAAARRTEAIVEWDGRRIRCMKGALHTIAELSNLDSATVALLEEAAAQRALAGARAIAVARAEGAGPLQLIGLAFLRDAPRPDAKRLIGELRGLGIAVKMLTGDALPVAREIADELRLGEIMRSQTLRELQANASTSTVELALTEGGFAEVFPEDKFFVVKTLQSRGHIVGMTGDGVNDAPALRQAEVGIAVNGATDVAKSNASAVLTTEGLEGIVNLILIGRSIYQRVLTWIVNKISSTIVASGVVVIAFVVFGKFVISALGMVLIVFMTDFVKIALATDRVQASHSPETWNITPLVRVAVALGILMLIEALGLLAFAWHRFTLDGADHRLQTFSFEIFLFFALFSLISIRERQSFWASRPSNMLSLVFAADGLLGWLIGVRGFGGLAPLALSQMAYVVAGAAIFVLGPNDFLKVKLICGDIRKTNFTPPWEAP